MFSDFTRVWSLGSKICKLPTEDYLDPSLKEQHRLHRALYYYNLSCKLFGARFRTEVGQPFTRLPFTDNQVSIILFSRLEVWEVEEIACIYKYIFKFYARIFQDCLEGLASIEPRLLYVRQRSYADSCKL